VPEENNFSPRPNAENYDVGALLKYAGPNLRQTDPLSDGVSMVNIGNSNKNEQNVSILLSSLHIPFYMVRPPAGWKGARSRMVLSVPLAHHQRALDILLAAAESGAVELVSPSEGFAQY
jgi:hypothetical protein